MVRAIVITVLLVVGLGSAGLILTGRVYIVQSNSMKPALRAGDAVIVQPVGQMPVVGDIITYEKYGKVITHRVVNTENSVAITKGDGNDASDPWSVQLTEIRGRVAARIPYLGYFLVFLRQPGGWFLFVLLPAALILYNEGRRAWRLYREWRQEESNVPEPRS